MYHACIQIILLIVILDLIGGWILYGASEIHADDPHAWHLIVSCSFEMPSDATATVFELEACLFGIAFVTTLSRGLREAHECLDSW